MRLSFVDLAALISPIVLAGRVAMPPASAQIVPSTSAQHIPPVPPDVVVLQAQRDEMRRTDDSLLSMVQWYGEVTIVGPLLAQACSWNTIS
jgi:hypothetical protein